MLQLVVKEECGCIGLMVMEDDLEDQSYSQSGWFWIVALHKACVTYDSSTEEDFTSPADATAANRALSHLDTYSYVVNSSG